MVRISPQEVAIADADSFSKIHKIGSGFLKSAWYDIPSAEIEPGIFAMRDPQDHAPRRRLFAKAFSNSSLRRHWEEDIRSHVKLTIAIIKADSNRSEADILKWWTLMTTDITAHLAFGESFHMLEQGKVHDCPSEPLPFSAAILSDADRREISL